MLSEEEIIEDIEDFLEQNIIVSHFIDETKEYRQFDVASFSKKDYLAIQGLLDLYNKEKEKNRLLIEGKFREIADKNSYIKDNYISKDKIREIIGELEKQEDWYTENKSLDDLYGKIDILQELLEERN